jgi:hypothetical protein
MPSIAHVEGREVPENHVRHILAGQTSGKLKCESVYLTHKTDLVQLVTEIDRVDVVALQIGVHDDLDRGEKGRWTQDKR